ncbi:MAG: PHP domain-containing protein [Chloroflexi bacterium]|nr:PHP domain-containing protein [Chloroflexota bacterium]
MGKPKEQGNPRERRAVVDLHLHTTESDGRLTPQQLVELVARQGLRVVAITDHDTTEGLGPAWEAAHAYPHLTVLPGIELSTDIPGNEVHILGYFIDHQDPGLQAMLEQFRDSRVGRAKEMVRRLGSLGIAVEWQRVQEIAGHRAIGRPHIAQAMVEKGYISRPQEAFEKYLGRNGLAYAERRKQTPEEAVQLVVQVGGVPVLAHPAHLNDLDRVIGELQAAGLQGMEVYYAEYPPETIQRLEKTARRRGLVPCGGSDYHAFGTPGEALPGEMGPPLEVVDRLRSLRRLESGVGITRPLAPPGPSP